MARQERVVRVIVVCYVAIVSYPQGRAERAAEDHMTNGRVNGKNTSHGQGLLLPSGHPSQPSGHHHQVVIGRARLFGLRTTGIPLGRV